MTDLRAVVVRVVVASFSLAALLGIIALLGADAFGDTGARVLGTTFVVGVESLAVLCYLAVAETRRRLLGVAGGVISLVPFAIVLWLIWSESLDGDVLWRVFGVGVTLAASIAQACLLSAVVDRPRARVRPLLSATFAAIVVLAAMIIYPVVADVDPGDGYWRLLGVVAILDVLGTVVVIALQKFSNAGPGDPGPEVPDPASLDPATASRLEDAARHRGTTPSALLEELLDGLPER